MKEGNICRLDPSFFFTIYEAAVARRHCYTQASVCYRSPFLLRRQYWRGNLRFINARRRIVQPMIDQSNRAGRPNGVNVFKNRRRKSSGQSPGPSPGKHNDSS
ncbi:unnamed protein product [Toxocara canis]|uniref:Uncharacterized protein n=1 Tax=Toxocara canis TaxID=6265 RepID=A0A183UQZ5_TOXCA|nr:unnamed protein product [Toxocara canis]